jgi:DNA-directed RNA polymerase specialized sigma24 family protein
LYTIALRVAADYARSDRRRPKQARLDEAVAALARPADCRVDQAEEVDNIWGLAREALSEEQFTAMWLRYGEDLSPAEVAQAMGRSRIAVRVMLHRARSAMIVQLGGERRTSTGPSDKSPATGKGRT